MTMRRSSHASSAYSLSSLAYSSAARTSWMEQGPTTCRGESESQLQGGRRAKGSSATRRKERGGTHDEQAVVLAAEDRLATLAAIEDGRSSCGEQSGVSPGVSRSETR